jgi:hypothetical protein
MSKAVVLRSAAFAGVLGLCAACGSQSTPQPATATPSPDLVSRFVRTPSDRAAMPSGTAGWPALVADPNIVVDEEGYHLFYTDSFCRRSDRSYFYSWDPLQAGLCDSGQAIGTTAYAFSRDRGLTWEFRPTPVVLPGQTEWNDGDVETPFVWRVADRLYLAYCAWGHRGGAALRTRFQIGVAMLDLGGRSIRTALMDGQSIFQQRPEPLVPGDFTQPNGINATLEPSVVVRDGRFELYFVSVGLTHPEQDTAAPGQQLSVALRRTVLDQGLAPTEPPSEPLLTGASANITEVRFFDGRYHLFATTTPHDDHDDDAITYAESQDGLHFTPTPILQRRSGATFDNWGLMAPTLAVEPQSLVLFYTAWEMQDRRCQLAGAGGRWGMAQESHPELASCLYATLGRAVAPRTP